MGGRHDCWHQPNRANICQSQRFKIPPCPYPHTPVVFLPLIAALSQQQQVKAAQAGAGSPWTAGRTATAWGSLAGRARSSAATCTAPTAQSGRAARQTAGLCRCPLHPGAERRVDGWQSAGRAQPGVAIKCCGRCRSELLLAAGPRHLALASWLADTAPANTGRCKARKQDWHAAKHGGVWPASATAGRKRKCYTERPCRPEMQHRLTRRRACPGRATPRRCPQSGSAQRCSPAF